jgi:hypothetical protein
MQRAAKRATTKPRANKRVVPARAANKRASPDVVLPFADGAAQPTTDDEDRAQWLSFSAFLHSNPLERYGRRRRKPLSELYAPAPPDGTWGMVASVDPTPLGKGAGSTVSACTLHNGLPAVLRVSELYPATHSKHYRREAARCVLLERLRERHPTMMQNVIQMIDYRLVAHPDGEASGVLLAMVLERAAEPLGPYIVRAVGDVLPTMQFDFLTCALAQLLAQLAQLQMLLPWFSHTDLHASNVMLQNVDPALGATTIDYVLQLGEGTTHADGSVTAPRLTLRVPLVSTGNTVLKIIDMDLADIEYLPQDAQLGDDGLPRAERLPPPPRMHTSSEARQYVGDAIHIAARLSMVFEHALVTHKRMVGRHLAVLRALEAFVGRLVGTYQLGSSPDLREFTLARILAHDPLFEAIIKRSDLVDNAPPVVGPRSVDGGHERVERVRGALL